MMPLLLTTKLHAPPTRTGLVARPHLIERLEAGRHRQLTLVSAPAGFGKTTLVTQWLIQTAGPSAWLSLDEGDNDPATFLAYLIAALQGIDEQIGQSVQPLLAQPQLPPPEALMTLLVNDIAAAEEPVVLVLDDYQAIRTPAVHELLEFLLTHGPLPLHVVLTTREDPPLPLPRLRVRGQVTEITMDDLRFTSAEASDFLQRLLGVVLALDAVAALEARTEGWVAGLQLAGLSLQGLPTAAIAEFIKRFSGSNRHVIDYLAEEVLARQPQAVREFMIQTSILERLTAPLCDAVTGRRDSQAVLKHLEQANLFLVPLDEQREWYRYQRLFGDFLLTELAPHKLPGLHMRAAEWLEARDLLPEAVTHALACDDVDTARRIVARAAEGAFRMASFAALQGWLDALSDEVVLSDGALATYQAMTLFFVGRAAEAAPYVSAAEGSGSTEQARPLRGRLLSVKAHTAIMNGRPDEALRQAEEALAILDPDDSVFRHLDLNLVGQVLEQRGDVAPAVDVYREVLAGRRGLQNELGALVLLTNLVFALNELGRRREALDVCREALERAPHRTGLALPVSDGIALPASLLAYEANELDEARAMVTRILRLVTQLDVADGKIWAHFILARVLLALGEVDEMHRVTWEGRRCVTRSDVWQGKARWFTTLGAQARLQAGDLEAAAEWAEAAGFCPSDRPAFWNEFPYFTYARLLLAQHRLVDARTLLTTLEQSATAGGRRRKLITVYLLQALAQRAEGRVQSALDRVEQAARLAGPEGYRRAFLDEGPALLELVPHVRHVAPALIDELLVAAGAGVVPDTATVAGPAQPLIEPLTERELEILQLIVAGRSNSEIADRLYISLNTVKWHVKNIYAKLGVSSRLDAAIRTDELGLL
jgi:LuxR family maltose regulon positive regulatory protein